MAVFRIASIFWLVLVAGCSRETPALLPLPEDGVVLAFGDSLTYGTGAGDTTAYPAVLSRLIGREVINEGVPGEISRTGLARLPALLSEYRPDLMILIHGGNDMLRKIPPAEIKANLRRMVAVAREHGVAVAMLGVPEPGPILRSADFYRNVAEETATPIDADTLADVLSDNALKSDAVHPNAAGYAVMAEALAVLLREAGAVE